VTPGEDCRIRHVLVSMPLRRMLTPTVMLPAALLASGCFDAPLPDGSGDGPGIAARDSVLVLAANDVRIVSTDRQLELALVGERVLMRMSDEALRRVRQELDTNSVTQSGAGAWIERKVKSTVQRALDKQLVIPVASIEDVRFENDEIRIFMRGDRSPVAFPGAVEGKVMAKSTFDEADAQKFVTAVKAAREQRS
jgi:hypothetical protein